jgi:hypothetical protein
MVFPVIIFGKIRYQKKALINGGTYEKIKYIMEFRKNLPSLQTKIVKHISTFIAP